MYPDENSGHDASAQSLETIAILAKLGSKLKRLTDSLHQPATPAMDCHDILKYVKILQRELGRLEMIPGMSSRSAGTHGSDFRLAGGGLQTHNSHPQGMETWRSSLPGPNPHSQNIPIGDPTGGHTWSEPYRSNEFSKQAFGYSLERNGPRMYARVFDENTPPAPCHCPGPTEYLLKPPVRMALTSPNVMYEEQDIGLKAESASQSSIASSQSRGSVNCPACLTSPLSALLCIQHGMSSPEYLQHTTPPSDIKSWMEDLETPSG